MMLWTCVLLALAVTVVALPLEKDEVHLAESGNIDDVVHTIEARTQKEIQALKADETKPPFSPKTIQDDEHDAQLAAEKVTRKW